jgi:hypothetical protein
LNDSQCDINIRAKKPKVQTLESKLKETGGALQLNTDIVIFFKALGIE